MDQAAFFCSWSSLTRNDALAIIIVLILWTHQTAVVWYWCAVGLAALQKMGLFQRDYVRHVSILNQGVSENAVVESLRQVLTVLNGTISTWLHVFSGRAGSCPFQLKR